MDEFRAGFARSGASARTSLALAAERAVVMCASATVASMPWRGLRGQAGRTLRWAVSSYTFFSQRTEPFATRSWSTAMTTRHDRSRRGRRSSGGRLGWIGRDQPVRRPPERTNRMPDFCTVRGKALMIDSAAALFGLDRGWLWSSATTPSVSITRNPGVSAKAGASSWIAPMQTLARSAINFGIGGGRSIRSLCRQWQAVGRRVRRILERLERLPAGPRAMRCSGHAHRAACARPGPAAGSGPGGRDLRQCPGAGERPVERAELAWLRFDVGKYYPPLDAAPKARHLFSHIINIPSHAGMASIEDSAVASLLLRLS